MIDGLFGNLNEIQAEENYSNISGIAKGQLIGGNLSIRLKITPASENYDASNGIAGFKTLNNNISLPQTQIPKTDGKAPPPWATK